MVMREVVDVLSRARDDDRVVGLLARVGAGQMGLAQIQELRDAIADFRSSGKKAVAWSTTFGEFGPGGGAYYLATAFDEIHLQPSGDIGLTGIQMAQPFLKGMFEKLGVVPQMDHRREYKSMKNLFTEDAFTDAHREVTASLAQGYYDQIVRGIVEGRGVDTPTARQLMDSGPHLGTEVVARGLVDGLAYFEEMRDSVLAETGGGAEFLSLRAYGKRTTSDSDEGTAVALIYGAGAVARGKSQYDPGFGQVMGSDTVTEAFRAAVDDNAVKAILFRVDSPGGSYVASDAIWRETVRAQERGKPVVVSMGNMAGSGGYFVAMSADRVVAQPGTLTGSIGVVAGKLVTRAFWQKLGMTWDDVSVGGNAGMFSELHPYSDAEWLRFQSWLDRVYDDFTGKVAQGRGMTRAEVEEVARGRVWTGEQALERGLVDTLGGFSAALAVVRDVLDLPPDAPIALRPFPPKRDLVTSIMATLSEGGAAVQASARLLRVLEPALPVAEMVGMGREAGVLQMPELKTRF